MKQTKQEIAESEGTEAVRRRAPRWVKIVAIVLAASLVILVALVGAAAIV